MPIKRAAYKAIRKDKKKHLRNISAISKIKTLSRNFKSAVQAKNAEEIAKAKSAVFSALDKAAQKGIIHKKNASRNKARLSILIGSSAK